MGRRKQILRVKRQQRGSTTLVFLFLLNCLHFSVSSTTTITYQRITVDTSNPAFASCPPKFYPLGPVDLHNPMFICNTVCDNDGACIFASVEGEFCKLFTVRLMIGSPSGTVGTGVYRNILDLTEPAQNLGSYVQAVTSTTNINGHKKFDTSVNLPLPFPRTVQPAGGREGCKQHAILKRRNTGLEDNTDLYNLCILRCQNSVLVGA
ncbi:hypothetical protein Pcinc_023278 [Petrolisthes cinctipes]|uniref:Apple domain-containing protein n=1 Tax=Petrolisthes cinctipes TaxID=88211 RepID=A0AAE1FDA9_PETCI|nr:hypothetical protein Pcinc_023278 [Petrolisthes cinctipes]